MPDGDERTGSEGGDQGPNRGAHDSAVGGIEPDPNRMLGRRSPVGQSESGLVSRDYQPRTGGPELIASWPLGSAPGQTEPGDVDWEVSTSEYVTLQKHTFTMPFVGPLDYAKIYLGVTGHARVDTEGETLSVELANRNLSGKPYEATAELGATELRPFASAMVEFAPETDEYDNEGRMYGGYELRAKVSDGVAYLDQGTAVQLWSE